MKYGFVYLWFDRKRKMFYIGCHWGMEQDGYVCSSTRMRNAYRRRPDDFKRRIISRVYTTRVDMLAEEFKFLDRIKDGELGTRYYNQNKHHFGHWTNDESRLQEISARMSKTLTGRKLSPETCARMSAARKGKKLKQKRVMKPMSEGHKQKIAAAHLGKKLSDEHRRKLANSKIGNTNRLGTGKK